jgi:DNA polymerase-3 subunit alpha
MSFFGSHCHTNQGSNLRLRDSINKIPEMFEYARSLGHKGIAITDHEAITAHLDALMFHDSIKDKEEWEGWKTALGNEIYLCSDNCTAENAKDNIYPHFMLIACDAEGHKGIRELSTKAWIDNSFMSVMMTVPTYYHNLEDIHNGGEASAAFSLMQNMAPDELQKYRHNLLKYCGLDTYAMVKIWEKLKEAVK